MVDGLSDRTVYALRKDGGLASAAANVAPNRRVVMRAVRECPVVHSSGAGWAFPLSYYVLGARRRGLVGTWIMVIESSFWRRPEGVRGTLRQRAEEGFHGRMIRRCLRAADARIFTQSWYRDLLLGEAERTHVSPAVWTDAEAVRPGLDETDAALYAAPDLRLVFPARLIPEKGVDTLLAAVDLLRDAPPDGRPPVRVDVVGEGPLRARCDEAAARPDRGVVRLATRDPVPYGVPFFELLRGYHAALVCNRSAEQPRIVFDVWSQGRPVLSSDTPGTRDLVDGTGAGWLWPSGDAAALADLVQRFRADRTPLEAAARTALDVARGRSHLAMHRDRLAFLRGVLPPEHLGAANGQAA